MLRSDEKYVGFEEKFEILFTEKINWETEYPVVISALRQKEYGHRQNDPAIFVDVRLWYRDMDNANSEPIPTKRGLRIFARDLPEIVKTIVDVYEAATGKEFVL